MKKLKVNVGRVLIIALAMLMVVQLLPTATSLAADANLELATSITYGGGAGAPDKIPSGELFNFNVIYTFRPLENGGYYTTPNIQVALPPGCKVKELITTGNIDIKQSADNPSYQTIGGSTIANFQLNSLNPGAQRQVTVVCYYDNMLTPNGTAGTISATVRGNHTENGVTKPFNEVSSQSVKILADDPWQVSKQAGTLNSGGFTAGTITEDDTHYTVTYMIASESATASKLYDRVGRLNFLSYSVVDAFPSNYPAGGGAELVGVSMTNPAGGRINLVEGTDYSVEKFASDNSISKLTLTKYAQLPAAGALVPAGAPVRSEYFVTVKYLKSAYETPTNQDLVKYTLKDRATLNYTLVGNVPGTGQADAQIELGRYETEKTPWKFDVIKKIRIGTFESILDKNSQTAYGNAQFMLYAKYGATAAERVLARNIKNSVVTPTPRSLDDTGKLHFTNLREGVYYLVETTPPTGFGPVAGQNPLKITIKPDGSVRLGSDDVTVVDPMTGVIVMNESQTNGKGIVELYKKGVDAVGNVSIISGARFELHKDSPTGAFVPNSNVETDADGYAAIHAVDPGTYYLVETFLPQSAIDAGMTVASFTPIRVVVGANQVVTVDSGDTNYPGMVMNYSPYGRFRLEKLDKADNSALAGAEFALYNDSAFTSPVSGYGNIKIPAAGYESGFIAPGTYYLKETKAPDGYKLDQTPITLTVSKNSKTTLQIKNEKLSALGVLKYGAWGSDLYYNGVSGARFKIYTAESGGNAVKDANGQDIVLISVTDAFGVPTCVTEGGVYTTAITVIPAGTYWLEEIAPAPAGYDLLQGRQGPIVVNPGQTVEEKVSDTSNYGRIALEKLNSKTNAGIEGVEFTIYKASEPTKALGTMTTNSAGKALSLPLEPGVAYILKETKAPSGYLPITSVIVSRNKTTYVGSTTPADGTTTETITVQKNQETKVIVKNDPLTGIQILKRDEGNNKLLQGAVFTLYSADPTGLTGTALANITVGSATTDANGSVVFSGLVPGKTYYYVEQSAPTGYVNATLNPTPTAPKPVVAPATGEANTVVTVYNKMYGDLKVQKKGTFDNVRGNYGPATFEVYPKVTASYQADRTTAGAANIKTLTTNASGAGTLANLVPGDYWLVETAAPAGFAIPANPATAVTITSGLNKTGGSPAYPTATVEIDDPANMGKFTLIKRNSVSNAGMSGVVFNLYKEISNGSNTYPTTPTTTVTTGANGTVTSGLLAPGKYKVVEASANGQYVLDTIPRYVTIEPGKTVTAMTLDGGAATDNIFKNTPKGRIRITKTATWTNGFGDKDYSYYLANAEFEIFPKLSNDPAADKLAAQGATPSTYETVVTGENGIAITTKYFAAGTFWVRELESPLIKDDFKIDGQYYTVNLTTPNADPALNFGDYAADNTPKKGRIQIIKRDIGTEYLLDGADFELYVVDNTSGTPMTITPMNPDGKTAGAQLTVKLRKATEQDGVRWQTGTVAGQNGTALTVQLDPTKTYYVREVMLSDTPIRVDGYQMINEWFGPLVIDADHPEEIVMQTAYNYKPTSTEGTKTNDLGNGVGGAYITLFHTESEAIAFRDWLKAAAPAPNAAKTNAEMLTPATLQSATFKTDHGIKQVVVSASTGKFQFANLVPLTTYYIVEAIAPVDTDGNTAYVRSETVYTMTLDEQGVPGTALAISNTRYGQIELRKIVKFTKDGQTVSYPLDEAKFDIYKAKKASAGDPDETPGGTGGHVVDTNCHYVTDGDPVMRQVTGTSITGEFISARLPAGHYIIKEAEAPAGFDKNPNSWHVQVAVGVKNSYLKTNPVENTPTYGRFEFSKVSSLNNKTFVSARFLLEKETSPNVWEAYILPDGTSQITTGSAAYLSPFIEPGSYRLTELSVVTPGYTMNTGNAVYLKFTVQAGVVTTQNMTMVNAPQGSIKFTKRTQFMNEATGTLQGASFSLYKSTGNYTADTGVAAYKTTTSGAGGAVSFTNVDAGNYWLVETATGNAAYGVVSAREITLAAGQDLVVDAEPANYVVDVAKYGKLKIKKADANAPFAALPNAKFEIYEWNPVTKAFVGAAKETITTDSNGFATSSLLDPAKVYAFKETQAPTGYVMMGTGIYTNGDAGYAVGVNNINNGEAEFWLFENEKPQTVIVLKTSSDTGSPPMENIVFAIFSADPTGKTGTDLDAIFIKNATTDAQGKAQFADMQPGKTYYIREVSNPTGYADQRHIVYPVTTDNSGSKTISVVNNRESHIKINKQAAWTEGEKVSQIPLAGVKFDIYRVDNLTDKNIVDKYGVQYDKDSADPYANTLSNFLVETITTLESGTAESGFLPPGFYVLIEDESSLIDPVSHQQSFTITNGGKYYLELKADETNNQYETNPILNTAITGRFRLEKYCIDKNGVRKGLAGAQFKAYKLNANGVDWDLIQMGDTDTITVDGSGVYLSPYIQQGDYKLVEAHAPTGYTLDSTTEYRFTVNTAATVLVEVQNYAKASIDLTKKTDAINGSKALAGVTFQLYKGSVADANKVEGEKVSNSEGKVTWTGLDAGSYIIREVSAPDGYSPVITDTPVTVTQKGYADVYAVNLTNTSEKGRILVKKLDAQGKPLGGAVFQVYTASVQNQNAQPGTPIGATITSNGATGLALSGLLDAAPGGTWYVIREIQAPPGYLLDPGVDNLYKAVLVKPIQAPAATDTTNFVSFKNARSSELTGFPEEILKTVKPTGGSVDPNSPDSIAVDHGLMINDVKVTFGLKGYANGTNPIAYDKFSVADRTISMQWYDTDYHEVTLKAGDYSIDKVIVYGARNAAGGQVNATVQYQTYAQLGTNDWTSLGGAGAALQNLQNLPTGATLVGIPVDLTGLKAMGVKVTYSGAGVKFAADGIDLETTFYKRAGGIDVHEIRRLLDKGELDYSYTMKDEKGNPIPVDVHEESNIVEVLLPLQDVSKPRIQLETYVVDDKTYYPNNVAEIRTVATNMSDNGEIFRSPVLAVDLPAYTFLKDADQAGAITVTYYNAATGATIEIPLSEYMMDIDGHTTALELDQSGNLSPIMSHDHMGTYLSTRRLSFAFPDLVLNPGDELMISYNAIISNRMPRTVTKLTPIAQISSAYKFPVSVENPLGRSFENFVINGEIVRLPSVDAEIDSLYNSIGEKPLGENEYLRVADQIHTGLTTELQIRKEIKGPLDDDFVNPGEASYTYPAGDLEYRLTLTNYSSNDVEVMRFVDILPFLGDTYVVRKSGSGIANARSTEVPGRATLTDVVVPTIPGVDIKVYYYTGDVSNWRISNRQNAYPDPKAELPMLYHQGEGSWTEVAGWTDAKPADMSTVTAVGVEAKTSALNGVLLSQDDAISVVLKMVAPGFSIEQVDQFYDKMLANSVGATVIYTGHHTPLNPNAGTEIPIENDEVISYMRLPVGSIGDFVFWDKNNNGIQDAEPGMEDEPLANIPVTLIQTRYNVDGTSAQATKHTTTDSSGLYLFEELPCNLLKEGAKAGSKDPADYIGGNYYEYELVFGDPSTDATKYAPAYQNEGKDDAIDSDIDMNRRITGITLNVSVDKTTGVLSGEDNMTYDAGFVVASALGDRVWRDNDRDGIQGPDEPGVNGVTVNLYRVINGVVEDAPYRTTVTQNMKDDKGELADGIYLFDDLVPGKYVVEFDISTLVKDDGHTYQYMFTKAKAKGDEPGVDSSDDSDAEKKMDTHDRIRRTGTITLPSATTDRTWDAGLTTYSAIGGYCYDDRNYNDVQDLGIALPGSTVTLYKYLEDGKLEKVGTQIVGNDGTYYFDFLLDGRYVVHVKFPENYIAVDPDVGGDDTKDSDISQDLTPDRNEGYTIIIDLKDDEVQLHWDAGAYLLGALGDYVWFDTNKDGIQDADEKPVAGVKATLQRREGAAGIWEYQEDTVTDEKGWYWFDELMGGLDVNYQYRVVFLPDDGTEMTIANAGTDTAKDSDALPVFIDELGYPTKAILLGYGEEDPTWDAGIIPVTAALGDYVWYDNDKDGIQGENEPGVEGVRVVLEYNVAGEVEDVASWREVGEQMTNSAGFYRFYGLREGYYRVTFYMPQEYDVTLLENAAGENGYEIDSDAITPGAQDKYVTRSIWLGRETTDWSWDGGIYQPGEEPPSEPTRTTYVPGETITNSTYRPGGTTYTQGPGNTVVRGTTVVGGTASGGSVRTGDDSTLWLWVVVSAAAGAAIIIAVIAAGRRKKAYGRRR